MNSEIRTKARVGKIRYTNCIPFYSGLQEASDVELYEDYPVRINQAMRQGKIDIAPVSSLEYLNHQKNYILIPGFAIGARDFSGSVLLFSKEKIDNLNGAVIATTRESLSSVALLRILLKFKYKFENTFEAMPSNPVEMLSQHKAALVIGDDALFYQPKEFVYKYDLSELWWNWAEKPFCFALWAVRREFAAEHPDEVIAFCNQLRKNLDRNLTDIESLIRQEMQLSFLDEKFSKVFGYLFNLNYGLDANVLEGLELFYRLATRLKISPRQKPLEFFGRSGA